MTFLFIDFNYESALDMATKPIKYSPNSGQPKQKAPFFERAVKRTKAYVTMNFNISETVKVKEVGTGNLINEKDKHGNDRFEVKNPTFDLIRKSYLNDDKTINVKKALNPFRAVDTAIKALKYSVARAVDTDLKGFNTLPSTRKSMIVKGAVQAIILPLELTVKVLKNVTDAGINSVINTVKKLQASREQNKVVTKNEVLVQDKEIQKPQQENTKAQSPSVAKPVLPLVKELGHSATVQHIHEKLAHNNKSPHLDQKIQTPEVKQTLKRRQDKSPER